MRLALRRHIYDLQRHSTASEVDAYARLSSTFHPKQLLVKFGSFIEVSDLDV
jgi:hypothetical protein